MKRVGILQYGGSFEGIARSPGDRSLEVYFAQQDTIENIGRLGERYGQCTLISVKSPKPYVVEVTPSSTAMGFGLDPNSETAAVLDRIGTLDLTHLIIQTPNPALIAGVQRQPGLRVAVALADSFHQRGVRAARARRRLVGVLNSPGVDFVANHGPNAARHLVALGVRHKVVIPYDFEYPYAPADAPVKEDATAFGERIVYAGTVQRSKGVFDLVNAMVEIATSRPAAHLSVLGDGADIAELRTLVSRLSLDGRVDVTGLQSHDAVMARLRAAAVSVVPSWHAYGEGSPLTIYEAWGTRTPLVATDHPMFAHRVIDELTGMVAPERDAASLARAITRLLCEPALYRRLSANASVGWDLLKGSVGFWPLVSDWLDGRLLP